MILMKRRGFTLMEMMVALGVVAALSIMLMAGIKASVQMAGNASCVSNLRQIGQVNLQFAQDNAGMIAAGSLASNYWWRYQIREYLGGSSDINDFLKVLVCPQDVTKGWGDPKAPYVVLRRSYALNAFMKKNDTESKKLTDIIRPSKTVYMGETGMGPAQSAILKGEALWLDKMSRERHSGKVNFVFLDGHVASLEIHSLYPGQENQGIFTGE